MMWALECFCGFGRRDAVARIDIEAPLQILLKGYPLALILYRARLSANGDKGVDSLLKFFGLLGRAADQKRDKGEYGDADNTVGCDIRKRGWVVLKLSNEEPSDWKQNCK